MLSGQRPLGYLHEKRIERAQYLIATTDLAYTEIAEKVGFENPSRFSKIFKKVTSLTPGEYKKQKIIVSPISYTTLEIPTVYSPV
jgi:AraC-like DNA-binding protein